MKLESVGEVIAARTLKVIGDQESSSEIVVMVGKPQQLPDHTDYYCPYQIKGAGSDKLWYACGIDTVQALMLVLSTLSVEIEVLNKSLGGKLYWEFGKNGSFGFPPVPPATL